MLSPFRTHRLCFSVTSLLVMLLDAAVVHAAPGEFSVNVGVVSDYRFRGLSLSDRRPALQGGIDLGLAGGWYVGAWGSTIARYGGSRVEVDLFGGRTGQIAGFDYSVSGAAYFYPRGERVNYGEVRAELSRTLGPATLAVEADYVPEQHNTATANLYLGARASLALPHTPLSITLRGGYEDGFYVHKLDWEAGVSAGDDRLSASVSLVGSDSDGMWEMRRLARTGVRLALATSF